MRRSFSATYAYAWLNVLLGGSLAVAMASPAATPLLEALAVVFPGADAVSLGAHLPYTRLMAGVAGGLWAGWGVALVGGHRGWSLDRILLTSVCVWFVLDQAASVACGAWGNVVVNTVFAFLALGAVGLSRGSRQS